MGYFANIKNVIRKTFSVKGRASLGEIWSYESIRILIFIIPYVLLILNLGPDPFSALKGLCWLIPLIPISLGEIWCYESIIILIFRIPYVLLFTYPFSVLLLSLCWIIPLIPMFALWIRRFHDNSMSAWWMIMWFIPLSNLYIIYYLYLAAGDEKENEYGPNPNQQ